MVTLEYFTNLDFEVKLKKKTATFRGEGPVWGRYNWGGNQQCNNTWASFKHVESNVSFDKNLTLKDSTDSGVFWCEKPSVFPPSKKILSFPNAKDALAAVFALVASRGHVWGFWGLMMFHGHPSAPWNTL